MDLFVYGTLRDPATFEAVTGLRLDQDTNYLFSVIRATVRGYRLESFEDRYPMAVSDPDGVLEGVVIRDLDDRTMARLDRYEGRAYRRVWAQARMGDLTLPVQLYVGKSEHGRGS